jgi:hypothetical protein
MVVIPNICFNIVTYLNKWFFLESPFLLFYFEFCNCQVLMLKTDKRQRIFISENVKIPVAQTFFDLCDIRDFLLLFSNRSDFLVIPEDELPGLVSFKTL